MAEIRQFSFTDDVRSRGHSRKARLHCNNYIFIAESDQTVGIFAIMIFDLDPRSLISTASYVRSIGNPHGYES